MELSKEEYHVISVDFTNSKYNIQKFKDDLRSHLSNYIYKHEEFIKSEMEECEIITEDIKELSIEELAQFCIHIRDTIEGLQSGYVIIAIIKGVSMAV